MTYLIAEAGCNHNGSVETAKKLAEAAAHAGFDAFKIQYWRTDRLINQRQDTSNQFNRMKERELTYNELSVISEIVQSLGLDFIVTPHDDEALQDLKSLHEERGTLTAIKIGSGEVGNYPFYAEAAAIGLPLFISTGLHNFIQVERIMDTVGTDADVTLMHCVSRYPTPLSEVSLPRMRALKLFCPHVGYSDHCANLLACAAAIAMGAEAVEKHIYLHDEFQTDLDVGLSDRSLPKFVEDMRAIYQAHLYYEQSPTPADLPWAVKAPYSAKDLLTDCTIMPEDVIMQRPTYLPGWSYDDVIGKRLVHPVRCGDPLSPDKFGLDN